MNATYFISDLHLSANTPALNQAFSQFIHEKAVHSEALYILGDLFEYWIGVDAVNNDAELQILDAMQIASDNTKTYFIAGNRDFLVDQQFEQRTGFTILADETVIDLYGRPTLIAHGDGLCTDDLKHQQFRQQMMLHEAWKKGFLALPIAERQQAAMEARKQSDEHKSGISMNIMDVNPQTVARAFSERAVSQMIHGHTHRQAIHEYGDNTRYVLGDWNSHLSYLIADENGQRIENEAISS